MRKFAPIGIEWVEPKDYEWKCTCGEPAFIDISATNKDNPFPCAKCFAEIELRRKSGE